MCLVAGFASLRSLAESYSRRAQAAAQNAQHHPALAWVLELTGVYAIGVGQWVKARDTLRQGVLVAHHLEDRRRWEECVTALSEVSFFQGRFAESLQLWPDIYTSARRRGDAQAQSWGLAGQLRSLVALGKLDANQTLTVLQTLKQVVGEDIGSADKINSYGIIALIHLRRGELDLAQAAAEAAVHWIAQSSPTGFGIIHGYNNAAEVCLALWEKEIVVDFRLPVLDLVKIKNPDAGTELPKSAAGQVCQTLHKFARAFPIGQPRAWLWQGMYDWLSGQPTKARADWQKSLATAEKLAMPYEQALTLYEIGRHLPAHHPRRRDYLTHAAEIFSQLNTHYDLNRAEQVLAASN
jgi:tetratricopeptide (TPR) repeat protein